MWQPPHQHWVEFARLLLEAGADPNDNQGLYNRMQYPNDEHLKLLFEYGLGKDQGGPWFKRFFQHWPYASAPRSPADILSYQLRWAVSANYFDRVKLLVENGADVNRTSQYPAGAVRRMRKPYPTVIRRSPTILSPRERSASLSLSVRRMNLRIACSRADADRVRELAAQRSVAPGRPEDSSLRRPKMAVWTVFACWWNWALDVNGKAGGRDLAKRYIAVVVRRSRRSTGHRQIARRARRGRARPRPELRRHTAGLRQTTRASGTSSSICFSSRRSGRPSGSEDLTACARCCARIQSA